MDIEGHNSMPERKRLYHAAGPISFLVCCFIPTAMLYIGRDKFNENMANSDTEKLIIIILCLLCGAAGIIYFIYEFQYFILDGEGIEVRNLFRSVKKRRWSQITQIKIKFIVRDGKYTVSRDEVITFREENCNRLGNTFRTKSDTMIRLLNTKRRRQIVEYYSGKKILERKLRRYDKMKRYCKKV